MRFVFGPIKDFNKERGDTSYLLLLHQAKITNASAANPKLPKQLKQMGAALISTMSQIPCYRFLVWLRVFGLPSKENVFKAAQELNGIAYAIGPGERDGNDAIKNTQALNQIAQLLKIETKYTVSSPKRKT